MQNVSSMYVGKVAALMTWSGMDLYRVLKQNYSQRVSSVNECFY